MINNIIRRLIVSFYYTRSLCNQADYIRMCMASLMCSRWSGQHDQWWECKFISEGIIDQGGGFRDSLCDLAEELCPSSSDAPVPVPFFIRTPNHVSGMKLKLSLI